MVRNNKCMEIGDKLLKYGLRLTRQRREVLGALQKSHGLVSALALAKKIKAVDRASVYRTLNLFSDLGIVNVETANKERLYCLADHPHHHIICRICGYSEKFPCNHNNFKKFNNFTNIEHHLTLSGLCSKCKNK